MSSTGLANYSGIIVTYNPCKEVIDNAAVLLKQCPRVVVVDNGSEESCRGVLSQLGELSGLRVLKLQRNEGVAAALNHGIRAAIQLKSEWVATFDQDSRVTPGFFSAMEDASRVLAQNRDVALLAPLHVSEQGTRGAVASSAPQPITVAITSGSVIRTDVVAKVGWFDEGLFIDYVDFDFCLRLRREGFGSYQVPGARLRHQLGQRLTRSCCGIRLSVRSHTALRRYYITRNRLLMWRRHALHAPGWCLHDFLWFWIELAKVSCLETSKRAKLAALMRGLVDGLAGRTGQLDPSVFVA